MIGTCINERLDPGKPAVAAMSSGLYMAEYRDSVASEEGFTPKQFHSTREKRAKPRQGQGSNDYMDDQDRYSFEVSAQLVPKDVLLAKPLSYFGDLPVNPTGVKILMNLGWTPSKGIDAFEYKSGKSSFTSAGPILYAHKYYGLGYQVDLPPLISEVERTEERPATKKRKAALNIGFGGYESDDSDNVGDVFIKRSKLAERDSARASGPAPKFTSKKKTQASKGQSMLVSPFSLRSELLSGGPPLPGFVISTLELCKNVEYPKYELPIKYSKNPTTRGTDGRGNEATSANEPQYGISSDLAHQALQNPNLPYRDDLVKQARYLRFLRDQAGIKSEVKEEDMPGSMNLLDVWAENAEFEKVARIFQPLSKEMAKKFVSETWNRTDGATDVKQEPNGALDIHSEQEEQAGLSGENALTVTTWQPSRLLSKRLQLHPVVAERDGEKATVGNALRSMKRREK